MSRIATAILSLASLALPLLAQTHAVGISPVPIWPKSGDVTAYPGHYVFLDLRSAAYVVTYLSPGSNERVTVRFGAHSFVDPAVTVHIAGAANSQLHYSYQVANGPYARQPIQKVSLLLPAEDTGAQAQHPAWKTNRVSSTMRTAVAPGTAFAPVEWAGTAAQAIAPGSSLGALSVDSTYLPGFIDIMAKGATNLTEYDSAAATALPKEAADQLKAVLAQGWDAKRQVTIGPRFTPATSPLLIAQNLYYGIEGLTRHKQLDANSPFTQAAQKLLSSYLESNDASSIGPSQLDFLSKANTPLESEIATVLRLDFAR